MKKTITVVMAIVAVLLFVSTSVFAFTLTEEISVANKRINGLPYTDGQTLLFEVGQRIRIDIELRAHATIEQDIEASARLIGYRYADRERLRVYDVAIIDGMRNGTSKWVTLEIDAPVHVERGEIFNLNIDVRTRTSNIQHDVVTLELRGQRNHVDIVRVSFDPEEVIAGRALRTRVRLENIGRTNERDVHIVMTVPELGLRATADVSDRINTDDFMTSEDILLRIPACTKAGVYDAVIEVFYDRGFTKTTQVESFRVIADDCPLEESTTTTQRTVITAPAQGQQIVAGAGALSVPVVIKNEGTQDRTYQVSVSGIAGWGTVEITEPAPIVKAGTSKVVQMYISALSSTPAGSQVYTITISDGTESREIPVSVVISQPESTMWDTLRTVLLVGIVILLILVIILGLIVGFSKVKSDSDKEYY